MENHRVLLYFTLFFLMYLLWVEWEEDYGPKRDVVADSTAPQQIVEERSIETALPEAAPIEATAAPSIRSASVEETEAMGSQIIEVETDVLRLRIDTRGGDILEAVLLDYLWDLDDPDSKISLLTDARVNFHIAQSGLVSADKSSAPTHKSQFTSASTQYSLGEADSIQVPLVWRNDAGVEVVKTYTFLRNSYVIDVEYSVTAGAEPWSGSEYMQLVRNTPDTSNESSFIYTYTGGVIYNDEIKYEKIDFDDIRDEDLRRQLDDGWLAMIQHYFLAAWIPQEGSNNLFYSRHNVNADRYVLGTRTQPVALNPGQTDTLHSKLVVGPKLQNELEFIAPGLELTVDYGSLTILAKPLFWLLDFFHGWVGNWGLAIILLTITVKLLFYKLSEMSYRSMAKMRKVAPRMQQMKERFGDDRQAMSKAMMDMYKREKINPLGGCFPILIQIPVFIALYWVLLESVEMRHAPFALWINNLSEKDPFYVLPVIMGVSMYLQQKLNPAPIDPVQQKVFAVMPFAFTIMFAFFPSGLVLYWVCNNILSIAQQYVITRSIEKASN